MSTEQAVAAPSTTATPRTTDAHARAAALVTSPRRTAAYRPEALERPTADTPRLTRHARERCEQMGVPTKRAKRVVQQRTLTYAGTPGSTGVIVASPDPDIVVVWDEASNVIVTVLPRTRERYTRPDAATG